MSVSFWLVSALFFWATLYKREWCDFVMLLHTGVPVVVYVDMYIASVSSIDEMDMVSIVINVQSL